MKYDNNLSTIILNPLCVAPDLVPSWWYLCSNRAVFIGIWRRVADFTDLVVF